MRSNSLGDEFENVAVLHYDYEGPSRSEQARGCTLAVLDPVAEGGLSSLHGVGARALGNVLGRFDPWIPYEGKQAM